MKGKKLNKVTPKAMVDQHIMYLNNNRKAAGLLLDMPVTDNVSLPVLGKVSNALGFINAKELKRISTEYIKKFEIALPSLSTKPRKLSGGNQQKVMMSACLAPELMRLSDRIKIMRDNSIVGQVECSEFTEQTIMHYAAMGTSGKGAEG